MDDPFNIISDVQPDVLVKGGDYNLDNIIGRDIVENTGGVVITIPQVPGRSSTNIIKKIKGIN